MEELTLILDNNINGLLLKKISKLKGISKIETTNYDNIYQLDIKYNSKLISIFNIQDFLASFISFPSIISFDKNSKNKLKHQQFFLENICCEVCFKNLVKELLLTDGIEYVMSYYDDELKNINMELKYNNNIINEKEILDLLYK